MTIDWLVESGVADERGGMLLVRVKAVPGAKRSEISGVLGDRLKVRIAAPPEDGKANKAVCELLAKILNLKKTQVSIDSGHGNPEKVIRIEQ